MRVKWSPKTQILFSKQELALSSGHISQISSTARSLEKNGLRLTADGAAINAAVIRDQELEPQEVGITLIHLLDLLKVVDETPLEGELDFTDLKYEGISQADILLQMSLSNGCLENLSPGITIAPDDATIYDNPRSIRSAIRAYADTGDVIDRTNNLHESLPLHSNAANQARDIWFSTNKPIYLQQWAYHVEEGLKIINAFGMREVAADANKLAFRLFSQLYRTTGIIKFKEKVAFFLHAIAYSAFDQSQSAMVGGYLVNSGQVYEEIGRFERAAKEYNLAATANYKAWEATEDPVFLKKTTHSKIRAIAIYVKDWALTGNLDSLELATKESRYAAANASKAGDEELSRAIRIEKARLHALLWRASNETKIILSSKQFQIDELHTVATELEDKAKGINNDGKKAEALLEADRINQLIVEEMEARWALDRSRGTGTSLGYYYAQSHKRKSEAAKLLINSDSDRSIQLLFLAEAAGQKAVDLNDEIWNMLIDEDDVWEKTKINICKNQAYARKNLAKTKKELGKMDEARGLLGEAAKLAESMNLNELLRKIKEDQSELY